MELIIIIIVILLLVLLWYYWTVYLKKNRVLTNLNEESSQLDLSLYALRQVNIEARLQVGLDSQVLESIETLIDSISQLIPLLNQSHPSAEMTWVIHKVSQDHLNLLCGKYFNLGVHAKQEGLGSFLDSMRGLQSEVNKIQSLLDDQDQSKFDAEAKYLKQKYFK